MKKGLKFVVRVRFSGEFEPIENWLAEHCKGQYQFEFDGVHETDTPVGQLDIAFYFEIRAEAEAFRDHVKAYLKQKSLAAD
ncbi:MAG: hypothetical protein IT565_05020 [Rhodospirillales bacterium]|nr:hypothetical protein [Rhodospirillales bacterium]